MNLRYRRLGVEKLKNYINNFDTIYDKYLNILNKQQLFNNSLKIVIEKGKVIFYVVLDEGLTS